MAQQVVNPFPFAVNGAAAPTVPEWPAAVGAMPITHAGTVTRWSVDCMASVALVVGTIAITAALAAWSYVGSLQSSVSALEASVSALTRLAASPSPSPAA